MAPARVVEAVDVLEHCDLDVPACLPSVSPNQFCLEEFEEALDSRVIKAISLAAHGRHQLVTTKTLLVLVRTELGAPIRVMNAAGRGRRRTTAISKARNARSCFMRLLIAQPITRRE